MWKVSWAGERNSLLENGGRFLDYLASQKLKITYYIAVDGERSRTMFSKWSHGEKEKAYE